MPPLAQSLHRLSHLSLVTCHSSLRFSNRSKIACLRAHFALLASLLSNRFSPLAIFLIASRQLLETGLTNSQHTRKLFLIASFSSLFSVFARITGSCSTDLAELPAEIPANGNYSCGDDGEARERGSIQAGIEREEPVTLADRRGYRPRSLRIARTMALRPEGIPGLPMPPYFSKALAACRASSGTVIWRLRVMRAFFFSADFAIPYFSKKLLALALGKDTDFRTQPSSRGSLTVARRSSKLLVSTVCSIRRSARVRINCEGEDRCRNALFSRMCGADIRSTGFASA